MGRMPIEYLAKTFLLLADNYLVAIYLFVLQDQKPAFFNLEPQLGHAA